MFDGAQPRDLRFCRPVLEMFLETGLGCNARGADQFCPSAVAAAHFYLNCISKLPKNIQDERAPRL
jgi:hypothetical protein